MKRFWAKVDKGEADKCWEWTASKFKNGYAAFYLEGKMVRAHRVSHFLQTGNWPEVVMHTCDNPICVNPSHLKAATQLINLKDRDTKGRTPGGRPGYRKLSKEQREYVLKATKEGLTQRAISDILKVSQYCIRRTLQRGIE